MPRSWYSFAASAAFFLPALLSAAVVVEKRVEIRLQPEEHTVWEDHTLRVRVESAREHAEWSPYPILLDENRHLEKVRAWVETPDGSKVSGVADDHDSTAPLIAGELHSSRTFRLVRFPPRSDAAVLGLSYTVRVEPYFPGGRVPLSEAVPIRNLSVRISGANDGWRWRIVGPTEGLTVTPSETFLEVSGELAKGSGPNEPGYVHILFGWGEHSTWRDVGLWYEGLLAEVPRRAPEIVRTTADVTGDLPDMRHRALALLDWVREHVRYVAVQVGIGGYQPSAPAEVLERGWGDCKDKSLLLVDLLENTGVRAYPALILASEHSRIAADFPTPLTFNHMIVAVPTEALATADQEPTSAGYLFVDPTLVRGRLDWLPQAVQGQAALVVRGGASELVETPIAPEQEAVFLDTRLRVAASGGARGVAEVRVSGEIAAALLNKSETVAKARIAQRFFSGLLPGADLGAFTWGQDDQSGVPVVAMSAEVELASFVTGTETRSFTLEGWQLMPDLERLDDAALVAVTAGYCLEKWTLEVPEEWCAPVTLGVSIENDVGLFEQQLRARPGKIHVARQSELRQRWLEGDLLAQARELTIAESLAHKRRIRLKCR